MARPIFRHPLPGEALLSEAGRRVFAGKGWMVGLLRGAPSRIQPRGTPYGLVAGPRSQPPPGPHGEAMSPRYAESTSVSGEKSRGEIERILSRYGADQFMYGWQTGSAIIAFRANNRQVKFVLPLPDRQDRQFTHTPGRAYLRSGVQQAEAYEQAVRQRWRALALVIKAKLEAVEAGITLFEDEFMAHLILPDGRTMGDWARPQIAAAYETGEMPSLLPGTAKRLAVGKEE